MYISSLLASTILTGLSTAKICRDITVSVSLTSRQPVFNIAIPQTNIEVTDFVLNVTRQGRNFTTAALKGFGITVGNYNISTTFCKPTVDTSTNPTIQILTHGIGFDKAYWDFPFHNYDYSYIDVATDRHKYCTISYDRLGIGSSAHGEPLNEIQSFLEVAALYQLTQLLRSGKYPTIPRAFKKIVHIGHSFGSAQTYALADMYPSASDGIILTGFSTDLSFLGLFAAGANFRLANRNQRRRFGPKGQNLPDGYLTISNAEANKYIFLKPKYYPAGLLNVAEKTKQPVTLGELLTLTSIPFVNKYAGSVMVFNGDSDLPFCGGDCLTTGDPTLSSIPAAVAKSFPKVAPSNFTSYIQPDMGHRINLHYNATGAYEVIQEFLNSKGLKST